MENEKLNNQKSPETLDQLGSRLNREVAEAFGTKPLRPDITIFNSKADLDRQNAENSGRDIKEVPDWLVAFATRKTDNIYILSPDVMPANIEGDGRTRFPKTLKHEIAHLYTKNLNSQIPSWLNEGISLYIAEQNMYKKMEHNELTLELLNEIENSPIDKRIYQVGYNIVNELVNLGGKELLLEVAAVEEKVERDIILIDLLPWLKK